MFGTLIETGATLTVSGEVNNQGTIQADPSTLTFADLRGDGEVVIDSGSTVVTQGAVTGGQTIAFSGGDGALDLTPGPFAGTIVGFGVSDTISLTGVTDATSGQIVNGNTLIIPRASNPSVTLTLDPALNYSGHSFAVDPSGARTTDAGRILTWTGDTSSSFGVAGNWNDITSPSNPAQSAPNQTDMVEFNGTGAPVTEAVRR